MSENGKGEIKNELVDYLDGSGRKNVKKFIKEMKSKYDVEKLKEVIKEGVEKREKNDEKYHEKLLSLADKYKPRKPRVWNEALNYVTHDFLVGDHILIKRQGGISYAKVEELKHDGYKVFIYMNRKGGIEDTIYFCDVLCHASKVNKVIKDE